MIPIYFLDVSGNLTICHLAIFFNCASREDLKFRGTGVATKSLLGTFIVKHKESLLICKLSIFATKNLVYILHVLLQIHKWFHNNSRQYHLYYFFLFLYIGVHCFYYYMDIYIRINHKFGYCPKKVCKVKFYYI